MKKCILLIASWLPLSLFAQAPAESEDVMLQGFYWNSQKQTGWTQLTQRVDEISQNSISYGCPLQPVLRVATQWVVVM